ncbi:MAG: LPS assembly lipoprotein LptE [Bacteroidales bacterium]|jgi:hypothetical protein|nr:LPS assembly lipoprotein LptE [Bacteroidales bacterium]
MASTDINGFILRNYRKALVVPAIFLVVAAACKISYSFSGASISPQVKTLSVQRFFNRAALVQPGLDQTLTDALIDMCRAQTSLEIVSSLGDVDFEGEITDYKTQPVTVAADAYAAMNRFTITVHVKFTNTIDPNLSFDQSFSRYEDYDGDVDLSSVEQELSDRILDMIVEDIFNRAFVNW